MNLVHSHLKEHEEKTKRRLEKQEKKTNLRFEELEKKSTKIVLVLSNFMKDQ